MSKLYVFGIGGTGSRVLKALTMMLSSGVECAVDTIVPIIIDPDDSAADKTRTVASMNLYMSIRENRLAKRWRELVLLKRKRSHENRLAKRWRELVLLK